jgi:hypothetical protein
MSRELDLTCTREIGTPERDIYMFDTYREDGSFYYEPCLCFDRAKQNRIWDNSEHVLDLIKRLKSKEELAVSEVKSFCDQNNLDYKTTRRNILDIYKRSKQLGFWKK